MVALPSRPDASSIIRQALRLAFLAADLIEAAVTSNAPFKLQQIPLLLPLSWREQRHSLVSIRPSKGMKQLAD